MDHPGVLRLVIAIGLGVLVAVAAAVAALVAFGTVRAAPPREGVGINTALGRVDYSDLPGVSHFTARDGARIAYRVYPTRAETVVLLLHGSASRGRSMHALGRALAEGGIATAYAIDVRGHGESGPRGHVRYVGQIDDDVDDIVTALRARHPDAPVVFVGFSAGGGFAMRFATGPYGDRADGYVFLAPYVGPLSPTNQPRYGGWATPYVPRIIGLSILNAVGIATFNHLPVVAYNLPDGAARELTPRYSWNLAANYRAPDDYRAALARLRRPAVLIVGYRDEDFRAEAYAADLGPHAPAMPIVILDEVNHMGLIVEPAALAAITGWVTRVRR